MVWWCEASDAGNIIKLARQMDGDVVAAAGRLNLAATPHARVIERVGAAISRIEPGVVKVNAGGNLRFFNSEFRKRRTEAAEEGRGFMSYVPDCPNAAAARAR
jgi:hypothetical protein